MPFSDLSAHGGLCNFRKLRVCVHVIAPVIMYASETILVHCLKVLFETQYFDLKRSNFNAFGVSFIYFIFLLNPL